MPMPSNEELEALGLQPGSKEASDYLKYLEDSSRIIAEMRRILEERPELRFPHGRRQPHDPPRFLWRFRGSTGSRTMS